MDRGRERGASTSVGPDDRPCAGCIMLRGPRAVKDRVALGDAGSQRTRFWAFQYVWRFAISPSLYMHSACSRT